MNEQEATENLLVVLRHPIRRDVLTRLMQWRQPESPRQMAEAMKLPLSNVSYHVRVMVECEALTLVDEQPVRGSIQHFYEPSKLVEHPMVAAALGLGGAEGVGD